MFFELSALFFSDSYKFDSDVRYFFGSFFSGFA